jgi:ribosome biogenesis protein YTM1
MSEEIRVSFVTKHAKFRVMDTPFAVPTRLARYGLSEIINHLLELDPPTPFDFLVDGSFLRTSLDKYLQTSGVSAEAVLVLEYLPAMQKPEQSNQISNPDWVSCVDATSDDYFLTGCYDGNLRMYSTDGACVASTAAHKKPIKALASGRGGEGTHLVATGSKDHTVRFWAIHDADGPAPAIALVGTGAGHAGSVEAMDIWQGGGAGGVVQNVASCSWDNSIQIWDVSELNLGGAGGEGSGGAAKRQRTEAGGADSSVKELTASLSLAGHTQAVSSVRWLSAASVVSGSYDFTVKVWDVEGGGQCTNTLAGGRAITAMATGGAGGAHANTVVTGQADHVLCLWDLRSDPDAGPQLKTKLSSHSQWVSAVAFARGGAGAEHLVSSASHDGSVKLWDVRSTIPLHTMAAHDGKALCAAWQGADKIITGGTDCKVRCHKLAASSS